MVYTDADVKIMIESGAQICKRIKSLYPSLTWPAIAVKFTMVKARARTYFPTLNDVELIKSILTHFSPQDIKDATNNEQSEPATQRSILPAKELPSSNQETRPAATSPRKVARVACPLGTRTEARPGANSTGEAFDCTKKRA